MKVEVPDQGVRGRNFVVFGISLVFLYSCSDVFLKCVIVMFYTLSGRFHLLKDKSSDVTFFSLPQSFETRARPGRRRPATGFLLLLLLEQEETKNSLACSGASPWASRRDTVI